MMVFDIGNGEARPAPSLNRSSHDYEVLKVPHESLQKEVWFDGVAVQVSTAFL